MVVIIVIPNFAADLHKAPVRPHKVPEPFFDNQYSTKLYHC